MTILFREQAYPTPTRASSSAFQPARQAGVRPTSPQSPTTYENTRAIPSIPPSPPRLTNALRPSSWYCMAWQVVPEATAQLFVAHQPYETFVATYIH